VIYVKKEVCFLGRKVTRNGMAKDDEYVEQSKNGIGQKIQSRWNNFQVL
jgi:hypothetical protein